VVTDDDNTSDEPAMRPVGLDLDDPGNPFPRFGLVLVVILAAFIVSGIDARWAQAVGLALTALLTVVTYREAYFPKRVSHVVVVGSVALVAALAVGMIREASSWRAVPMFIQAAVLAWLVLMLVQGALRSKVVDIQTILAAISAYMVIGLAYSWLYLGMEVVDAGQFSMPSTQPSQFFEFSFIVQTTVGFGNQLPTQSFSSRIVVTQAVLGQVFLVTLVARLVSLYGNARRTTPDGS
jgi:Ion channel